MDQGRGRTPATATATVDAAVRELFADLDAERFVAVARRLAPDVELADELTGEWLRGDLRVAAYLGAQQGIVTDVHSELSSLRSRLVAEGVGVATFAARQRYRLDGVPRTELLTGSATFRLEGPTPLLLVFHLGTRAEAWAEGAARDGSGPQRSGLPEPDSTGRRIHRLRTSAKLSLRALGRRTCLSAGFLSQLERDQTVARPATLARIAETFGIPVDELLTGAPGLDAANGVVVRRDRRPRTSLPDAGLEVESLQLDPGGSLQVWVGTLRPGASVGDRPRAHDADRLLLVLSGRMRLLHGRDTYELGPGDAAQVDAATAHRIATAGDRPLRFLSVNAPRPAAGVRAPRPERAERSRP